MILDKWIKCTTSKVTHTGLELANITMILRLGKLMSTKYHDVEL